MSRSAETSALDRERPGHPASFENRTSSTAWRVIPHNLASYLRLLDWSARLFRPGKARMPVEVAGILERLGSSADVWRARLEKLRQNDRLFGVVFGTSRAVIQDFATVRGVSKLSNLNGCPG